MDERKIVVVAVGVVIALLLSGSSCDDSNDQQNRYADRQGEAAQSKVGDPKINNFAERKLANEVAELRDRTNLVMYAYLMSYDGSLRCYGQVIGYGIPYGVQITPPYRYAGSGGSEPVREPNGLFMPDSADATWIRVVDPATGKSHVDYVEPHLIVSAIKRPCKELNQ